MSFSPDIAPAMTPAASVVIGPLFDWCAPTDLEPAARVRPQPVEGPVAAQASKWSVGEILLMIDLAQNYKYTNAQIAERLPGRSANAVKHKLCSILDRGRHKWTAEEEDRLRRLARSRKTLEEIAKILKRTSEACRYKIRALGLEKEKKVPAWSPEELKYLQANYHSSSMKDLQAHLGRTRMSIAVKASRLGLTNNRDEADQATLLPAADFAAWSEDMVARLRELAASGFSLAGLRASLKRDAREILAVAEQHHIAISQKCTWHDTLTARLRELAAARRTRRQIAVAMGLRPDFISMKARAFGIKIVRATVRTPAIGFRFAPGESSVEQMIQRLQSTTRVHAAGSVVRRRAPRRLPNAKPSEADAVMSREAQLAKINEYLAANSATKAVVRRSLVEDAILTLRRQGDVVFAVTANPEEPTYKVNYSTTLSRSQLIARANAVRVRRGEAPLPCEVAQTVPANAEPPAAAEVQLAACA